MNQNGTESDHDKKKKQNKKRKISERKLVKALEKTARTLGSLK